MSFVAPAVVQALLNDCEIAIMKYGSFIITVHSSDGGFRAYHESGDDELRPSRNSSNQSLAKLKETLDRFVEKGWAAPKRDRPNVPCKLRYQGKIIDATYIGLHLGRKKLVFIVNGTKKVVGERPNFYPISTPQTVFDALTEATTALAGAEHALIAAEVKTDFIPYDARREELVRMERQYAEALTK